MQAMANALDGAFGTPDNDCSAPGEYAVHATLFFVVLAASVLLVWVSARHHEPKVIVWAIIITLVYLFLCDPALYVCWRTGGGIVSDAEFRVIFSVVGFILVVFVFVVSILDEEFCASAAKEASTRFQQHAERDPEAGVRYQQNVQD